MVTYAHLSEFGNKSPHHRACMHLPQGESPTCQTDVMLHTELYKKLPHWVCSAFKSIPCVELHPAQVKTLKPGGTCVQYIRGG